MSEHGTIHPRDAGLQSPVVVLAALVIVLAGVKLASDVVAPFLLSIFLAVLTWPIVHWLHGHRVPKFAAILVVVGGVIGFFSLIGVIGVNALTGFNQNLPLYQQRLQSEFAPLMTWIEGVLGPFNLESPVNEDTWREALSFVANTLLQFGSAVSKGILAVLTVLFMLLEAFRMPDKLTQALGTAEKTWAGFRTFAISIQKYLAIKTATSLATGILAGLWVWILGIDYALFWGLLAFLLNYIPNIGSFIAGTPAVLMALVQFGVGTALLVAIGYLVINVVIGGILEPHTMGSEIGLSPLVVLMSLVVWGWLLGGVGMVLSTPLTMSAKIALGSFSDTRWMSILIGSGKP